MMPPTVAYQAAKATGSFCNERDSVGLEASRSSQTTDWGIDTVRLLVTGCVVCCDVINLQNEERDGKFNFCGWSHTDYTKVIIKVVLRTRLNRRVFHVSSRRCLSTSGASFGCDA